MAHMRPGAAPNPPAGSPNIPGSVAAAAASVAAAPDPQLARIVAVLDALPARGPADALIAAARPRLATLRPERPPSLLRGLLDPLTPLLRAGSFFDATDPSLSRPAAVAIARAAIAALAPAPPGWHRVADWLATAPPPPDWAATGRADDEYPPIRDRMRAVLALADDLSMIQSRVAAPADAPADRVRDLLDRARAISEQGEAAVLALLLSIPALAGPALALAARAPALRAGALNSVLAAIAPPPPGSAPEAGISPRAAAAAAATLAALAQAAPNEAAAAARAMDQSCQASLAQAGLALARHARTATTSDAILALEAAARDLRCLATTAARLGSPAAYERIMTEIAGAADLLPRADAARLTEILLGTEAALPRLRAPR